MTCRAEREKLFWSEIEISYREVARREMKLASSRRYRNTVARGQTGLN